MKEIATFTQTPGKDRRPYKWTHTRSLIIALELSFFGLQPTFANILFSLQNANIHKGATVWVRPAA